MTFEPMNVKTHPFFPAFEDSKVILLCVPMLAQHSVKLPENEKIHTKQERSWLDQVMLPDSDAHLLHADCKLHDNIEVQITSTDTLINKLAAQDPLHRP